MLHQALKADDSQQTVTVETAGGAERSYPEAAQIRAVQRAVELMRALSQRPAGATVSELAGALSMPKSSVYRLLVTLRRYDWVAFDAELELYSLGVGLLEVSTPVLDRLDLRELAKPHLMAILSECDESVHLGLLQGTKVMYALKYESTQTIRMCSAVGKLAPLHCTGLGKAMLAFMGKEQRQALLARMELTCFTETTLTDPTALQADLELARRRGYATDNGEHEDFVRCVAAPVTNADGLVGAISIAAPAFRMTDERSAALGQLVKEHCAQISGQLRHVHQPLVLR